MGVFDTDEALTEEEQALIDGESAPEPEPEPDGGSEPEPIAEPEPELEPKPDGEGEPDGTHQPDKDNLIPQGVFDKRVAEIKTEAETEAKTKLDLFKTDQEAYYEKYPDEKPEETKTDGLDPDLDSLFAKDGQYAGKSLKEIYEVDPAVATQMQVAYYRELDHEARQKETDKKDGIEAAQKEIDDFGADLANELYGKSTGLSEEENKAVNTTLQDTLDWMAEHKRGGGVMIDGYFLMNRERDISKARGEGAQDLVKQVTGNTVQRISSSRSSGEETGYEADMSMSRDDLAAKIDLMSEDEHEKYMKDAPDEFKKKFDTMSW